MHEPLKDCPFCGAAAHFEMDEGRWEWVECESCGMQGNRSASLMEDCKPKLAEEWNRRTPAPVGVLRAEKIVIPTDTMEQEFQKHYRSGYEAGKKAATQQPTQAQAGAVPLTDEQIEALPLWKRFVGLWPETRREIVRAIEAHHGIKGGQHGTE